MRFVSGPDFSRAVRAQNRSGFSPRGLPFPSSTPDRLPQPTTSRPSVRDCLLATTAMKLLSALGTTAIRFVSGPDFSRAVTAQNGPGFSPCGDVLPSRAWKTRQTTSRQSGRTDPSGPPRSGPPGPPLTPYSLPMDAPAARSGRFSGRELQPSGFRTDPVAT
jgi:hypothetical protein